LTKNQKRVYLLIEEICRRRIKLSIRGGEPVFLIKKGEDYEKD